ncbi:hypothetical protein PP178_04155 [Zeaxanthinibacter sp. PT1]|uniref:hypothetical protein n=1 Tax=Zeaxanthinibacter TaxID=561554 RepID=UPI0023494821|nr:hypothetical protein [Zeaxanthinibacter sp. PT1]MDC6350734.1 hypothetical protein [Zeaxanthinibacter sp. PT1]
MPKNKYTHSKGKWKCSKNTYMPIEEMEDDHIQKALYYTENRIVHWQEQRDTAEHNFNIFKQKREELLQEAETRDYEFQSLLDTGATKYALLAD